MQQSRFMLRMILILSVYCLIACAPSPEKIAGQTATAEKRAVEATVRAAKSTSRTWTPTPDPETLYPVAVEYCEDAFNKDIVSDEVMLESSSLLTLSILDWESDSGREQNWLGSWQTGGESLAIPFLEASSAQDVRFLICIKVGRTREGTYSDGAAAYRPTWSLRLVQLSDGRVIGEEFFTGDAPPVTKPEGNNPGYGNPPGNKLVLKWLLPYWNDRETILLHDTSVNSIAFSPDGDVLASGGGDNELKLWDVSTGKELHSLTGHKGEYLSEICVAFSPDGDLLASGSSDETVKLWDVSSGEELRTFSGHEHGVNSVAFSPNGEMLASASGPIVKLWDVSSGEELLTLSGHEYRVNSIAFSPDGDLLASGSKDHTIKLWDISSGEELRTLSGHEDEVNSVAFSPNGDLLASVSDVIVKLWDVSSGKELPRDWFKSYVPYESVAFSPDGTMLAYGGRNDTVVLSDVSTGMELITLVGHEYAVKSVAFSPDGELLASAGNVIVKLWDLIVDE